MITREALRVLTNNLTFTTKVNRQYDDKFGIEGAKIGTTLNVRKPPRYVGRVGQALQLENAVETQVPVVLNTQRGVDIQFSSADLALSIDDFSARFIKPAIASVANAIDYDGLQLYKQVYQSTNITNPATTPAGLAEYLAAGVKLDESATPIDGERYMIVNPDAQAALVGALYTYFNPQGAISTQYTKGVMGQAAGFTFAMDQNVGRYTAGTRDNTTPITATALTSLPSASLSVTGADATVTFKEGDVFTIADCYSVNPQSRQANPSLQQFVVTADAVADGAGAVTLAISPSIITSGPFQTCTGYTTGKALVHVGAASTAYAQNLAFHKDAFTLACADLPLPGGVDMAARVSDKQTGLSLRLIRAYNVTNDQFPCRLDILYGWACLRPELACRVWSK